MDFTASDVPKLSGISRVAINKIFNGIRERIFHHSLCCQGKHAGEFEVDESYLMPREYIAKGDEEPQEKHLYLVF